MKIAVWDTYVRMEDNRVLHFDIMVPFTIKNTEVIFTHGRKYLQKIGVSGTEISSDECRFCHIEEPTDEMKLAIERQGYFILDLGWIPERLPDNYSRRDLIFHLKGHFPDLRFVDMRGKSIEELLPLLSQRNK